MVNENFCAYQFHWARGCKTADESTRCSGNTNERTTTANGEEHLIQLQGNCSTTTSTNVHSGFNYNYYSPERTCSYLIFPQQRRRMAGEEEWRAIQTFIKPFYIPPLKVSFQRRPWWLSSEDCGPSSSYAAAAYPSVRPPSTTATKCNECNEVLFCDNLKDIAPNPTLL